MREKMARAIYAKQESTIAHHHRMPWEKIGETVQAEYFADVDAALDVLMEPTESVVTHVADVLTTAEMTAGGRFVDGLPLLEWVWIATLRAIKDGK